MNLWIMLWPGYLLRVSSLWLAFHIPWSLHSNDKSLPRSNTIIILLKLPTAPEIGHLHFKLPELGLITILEMDVLRVSHVLLCVDLSQPLAFLLGYALRFDDLTAAPVFPNV